MMLFNAFKIAFTMYSTIPVGYSDWNKKNMKYAICFFPLVGAVLGGVLFLWYFLCNMFEVSDILFAGVASIIPFLVTGGIHMDGFCDTVDALSSNQPRERKLEILKDSHTGAFAIFYSIMYFLLTFCLWCEVRTGLSTEVMIIIATSFVISRSLSGFAIVTYKNARKDGLLQTFKASADEIRVRIVMVVCLALVSVASVIFGGIYGMAVLICAGLVFLYYSIMSKRQFGGVTGDLAGFFLQLCELSSLVAVTFVYIVLR